MTPATSSLEDRANLDQFLRRGGGIISLHDGLCSDDTAYFSNIVGGAKRHGEVNYTLEANVPYTIVDTAHPIMQGMTDFKITDEAFFLMTWSKAPEIHVLATAVIDGTPSAGTHKGEVVPQMWTYEKSLAPAPSGSPYRAFVWMQGHNYANFALPNVQQMLLRAIAWAGKRPVDTLMTERPQRGRGRGRGRGDAGAEWRQIGRKPELDSDRAEPTAAAAGSWQLAGSGSTWQIEAQYRSAAWFGKPTRTGSFIGAGWAAACRKGIFDGRPIIGICNTWSELTPCNPHFREIAEHVKRGVWEGGGIPFEFPVTSLGETSLRPTAMLFRNLAAMDVEESIRGNPIDGVVLLCGCDKTTPALVMGAASCDLPAIVISGGPMLNGKYRGKPIGSGHRRLALQRGSQGRPDDPEGVHAGRVLHVALDRHLQRHGHGVDDGVDGRVAGPVAARQRGDSGGRFAPLCPGAPGRPPHRGDGRAGRPDLADPDARGVRERDPRERRGRRLDQCRHPPAGDCRPVGVPLSLQDWDDLGRDVPTLVDLMPSGRFLMEDFYYAGGLPAVIRTLGEHGRSTATR